MRLCGLRPWLWTLDPEDWRPGDDGSARSSNGLGTPRDGDVLLLHDGNESPEGPRAADRSATVEALPGIIAAARERGLRLEPVEGPR